MEIIKSYIFVLIVLSLLIWVTQATRLLNLITETGLTIPVYAEYTFYQLPKIISQLMLLSFLISIFLVLIKFQNNKEIEIYWLSGISKNEIVKLIIIFSLFITFIALIFFIYISPLTSSLARNIIANSEFSMVNSLVKKNNFNSPLKELTVYVHKNNNKGYLEKIYIFENNKTIISKEGRVLNINKKKYLELTDGIIHEKNIKNEITTIKFQKTLYDFTKYKTDLILTPKLQERKFSSIIHEFKETKNKNILYEIHKRLIKPLFIPAIAILSCFILFSNNEKIKLNRLKTFIFILATLLIILIEILLSLSTTNQIFQYFFYFLPILLCFLFYIFLNNFLKNECLN